MNRIRFFNKKERMDPSNRRRKRTLDRSNATKHIDYDAASSSSSLDDSSSASAASSSSSRLTQSLDIPDRTSFRIEGTDGGELDRICRSIGLAGPDDFAIPAVAWEAMKLRSSSDVHPRSRLNQLFSPRPEEPVIEKRKEEKEEVVALVDELCDRVSPATELARRELVESGVDVAPPHRTGGIEGARVLDSVRTRENYGAGSATELTTKESAEPGACSSSNSSTNVITPPCSGIKGARPLLLKPPPAMTLLVVDHTRSTWDILRDFAPESEQLSHRRGGSLSSNDRDDDDDEDKLEKVEAINPDAAVDNRVAEEVNERALRVGETAALSESCSFTTSNDDDSSSTTTEPPSSNSPAGIVRSRRVITYWEKGDLLGSGSFGSVYEGISE